MDTQDLECECTTTERTIMHPPRPDRPSGDAINHPPHYTAHPSGVECIDIAEHMGYNIGNAMKYLWRADYKGAPIEDLHKALWFIRREITRRQQCRVAG